MHKKIFQRTLLTTAVCAAFLAVQTSAQAQGCGRLYMKPPEAKARRQFYSLQSKQTDAGTEVELRIYDEIGFWGITAKDFIAQIDALAANAVAITVAVNSPGGDVFDAFAIYNALRRYQGKVTARVDGVAASAASLVVMAGDTVVMPENAMLMIHNPWTIALGTAEDMRKTADMMDKARDGIVAAYRAKSGQDEAELIRMMDDETWITALEAQALGFADVIEEPVKLAASARTGELLARFRKAPPDLLNNLVLNDEPPEPAPAPEAAPAQAPAPDPAPAPVPAPADLMPEPVAPSALIAHVYSRCRAEQIGHLSEAVLLTCSLKDQAGADGRIAAAKEIVSLCVAARLPDMASSLVASGLDVEQARARLFDAVTARDTGTINPRQRLEASAQPNEAGPNAGEIYAARRAAMNHPPRRT